MNPKGNNISNTQPSNNSVKESSHIQYEVIVQPPQKRFSKSKSELHAYNTKKKREQRSYERVRKTYMSKPTVIHHFVSPQALASLQNSPLSSSPLRSYNESLQFFSSPSTVSHNFNATDPLIDSRNHPPLQVPSHLLSQKPFQYHMPLNQLPNPFSNMRPPLQIPVPGVIQHSISLSAQQQTIPSIRQIHFPPTSEPYSNFNKNFASIVSSANGNDNDPKKANNLTDLVEVLGEKKPR